MADEQARQFIHQQLVDAGMKPTDESVLDYAMCTIELMSATNMKLHERIRELEQKLSRRRTASRAQSRAKP